MCHKGQRICSVCRIHNPVLSLSMAYHRVCDKNNTTGTTIRIRAVCPFAPLEFTPVFFRLVRVAQSFVFCVVFLDHCLSLCYLSFSHCIFTLRSLNTHLVSSNFSACKSLANYSFFKFLQHLKHIYFVI